MSTLAAFAGQLAESPLPYPPKVSDADILAAVRAASQSPHPRLLVTGDDLRGLAAAAESDPLMRDVADAVIREADALLESAPIKRIMQGRRLLGESRRCVKRTLVLATAYHLTGTQTYADRCRDEMLAVAAFSDWNPSHYLDVAEMTFAMALGYDWLFDQIDAASRQTIRDAILQKGVRVPLDTQHKGWTTASNNWGQVCHGGMLAGALAVLEDDVDAAAATLQRALENVPRSMAAYAPNGSYPEGPGYWSYGTTYNVLLIAMLERAFGTDFGLTKAPGFELTGEYMSLATGPSGLCFNYADGGSGRGPEPALFWFAERFSRPDWLLGEAARLGQRLPRLGKQTATSGGDRFLPLVLHWMTPQTDQVDIRMPLHWNAGGSTPVAVHRSSWANPNATYIGLKAGSPSGPHGQMDTGSFVLDADGVRWALDLGAEGYHGIESRGMNLWNSKQDSDRWRIFRQMNHGHNTLVIDDQLQVAAGHATMVRFSAEPGKAHSVVDLSPVYKGQAQSVQRGVALLPSGEVLIQDSLTGLKPGSTVRWGMITPGEPRENEGGSLILSQKTRVLALQQLGAEAVQWQIIDTAKPRNEWDSPNRGTLMVALERQAPESGTIEIAVLMTPGGCRQSLAESLQLSPLSDWE